MKTNLYTLLLISFTLTAFSQNNLLNQKDSLGKKHGKWLVYWDSNWKELKDSSQSVYHRYTVYDHGENIYPMGSCGAKGWKLESTGNPSTKLLDGAYKWYNSKGQLSSEHLFKNGEYLDCKEYSSDGKLNQHFAYSKIYKDKPNTYGIYQYSKGNTKYYIMCKGPNGWAFYPCSADDMPK